MSKGTWFVCAECKWEGTVACGSGEGHDLLYGPKLTVDALIEYQGRLVLIQRADRQGQPTGKWALPGGYVDFRERLVDAVVREAREETGLELLNVEFFALYDDPERDRAEGRNNVSAIYTAFACGELRLPPDKEVVAIRGCTREEIRDRVFRPTPILLVASELDPLMFQEGEFPLAFDHGRILADYYARHQKTELG